MAQHLSIKSAPAEQGEESPANLNILSLEVPEGTSEAVRAGLQALVGILGEKAKAEKEVEESAKAGARHSKADIDRLQQVHDHACALGALCHDHNTPAPEDGEEGAPLRKGDVPAKPAKPAAAAKPAAKKSVAIKADVEGEEASDQAEALGLPLDKLVEAVRSAFWNLRTEHRKVQALAQGQDPDSYYDWDDTLCPCCEAVYDGYAIAKVGLTFYKAEFEVTAAGVVIAPQADWQQVSQEWVTKSADLMALLAQNARAREVGAVKTLGANRLGNYLMLWGDEQRRDLYGEYFTKETEGLKAIYDYMGKLPALYQHAMDGVVKYSPVGVIDVLEIDEVGLWMETQLDLANEYAGAVMNLAKKKALGASSGALPGSRKVRPNGEIYQWAIIEGSFTPTPAEPRLRELGVAEVKSIYAECGLEFPNEEALRSASIGGEEPRQETEEAALEDERLRLLELSLTS